MAETLATINGDQVDVDQAEAEFAAAMAAPPADRPGMAAPARKPPQPAPDPEAAPRGWVFENGDWRAKKAPGRGSGTGSGRRGPDRPRVSTAPAAPKASAPGKPAEKTEKKADFRKPLLELCEAAWFVLATAPIPDQAFGQKLVGIRTKVRVQAAVIQANANGVANGLNTIGQHNAFMNRALTRIANGEGAVWVLPAVMMLAPVVAATGQLWSGNLADQATLDNVAAKTEEQAAQYVEQLAGTVTEQTE